MKRPEFSAWHELRQQNFFSIHDELHHSIRFYFGDDFFNDNKADFEKFGAVCAEELEELIADCDFLDHGPKLDTESNKIEFHPSYNKAGSLIWKSGILSNSLDEGHAPKQALLFYLLAHQGEGGHCCPIACTSGLIHALDTYGSEDLKEQFLPPLLESTYENAHMGAQFLTEIQGGSDVGANRTRAAQDENGTWRISGEKWFCSVANAEQFFVTARVGDKAGTKGLGAFLIPRHCQDGTLNHFQLNKLKDKFGTRAMATGEIEFNKAIAYPLGAPEEGIKIAVGLVLNTSRWINALGSTGAMRRAYVEASTYAETREAFGKKIGNFPLVQNLLLKMRAEEQAALGSTLYLTKLINELKTKPDKNTQMLYRFLINANKISTALNGTEVIRTAIELLGGNGTIEDFCVLPRLLRDNIVFENWEGTHNVLATQILKDCQKQELHKAVFAEIDSLIQRAEDNSLLAHGQKLRHRLDILQQNFDRAMQDEVYALKRIRDLALELLRCWQIGLLLAESQWAKTNTVHSNKAESIAYLLGEDGF
ncbi:MAG: acyl-CoA dehydrogenase [Myxococcales bacterium]|nr:acyl-CoA dehydrogenase [Myxococcales bacterium]|tara:strand:+ start:992 stop:2602 length:1611 start_codon:yes stop_codon:yes gene_type:complete